MKRRTMLMLMLLGLGIASFPQVASAQSSPLIGTWKLNVEKSKSYGLRVIDSAGIPRIERSI